LLLDGAEDKYELENACLPLFSLTHWPLAEKIAYCASQTDIERNQVVLRRMDNWAAAIEARQSPHDLHILLALSFFSQKNSGWQHRATNAVGS